MHKCPYCDFNSHALTEQQFPEERYIDALITDIDYTLPLIAEREIKTIFIGGGTPSLFSPGVLTGLFNALYGRLNISAAVEISMEANPGTAESGRFQGYRQAGINRISIGVQSFNNHMLQALGRIHNSEQAYIAVDMARAAGFDNINLDLMYGLPGQDTNSALDDLHAAIDLKPEHISRYQLTIEPNTVYYSHPPELPDDDSQWTMQEQGKQLLDTSGYRQYEISAYARAGRQCRHNLNYWQFGDYLGVGAGAHSKITDQEDMTIRRFARHRLPDKYMQLAGTGAAISREKRLTADDVKLEFMMNVLRLNKGFSESLLKSNTGLPLDFFRDQLQLACEQGMLEWNKQTIVPTVSGFRYLNDLLQFFMPDETGNDLPETDLDENCMHEENCA